MSIADEHVAAFEAGLNPNEMDGADWVDFLEENQQGDVLPDADDIRASLRVFVIEDILRITRDGESIAQTIARLFPQITEGQAIGFEALAEAIGAIPEEFEV